ncbi:MAG: hypothetical protein J2P37_11410 [Ktedonobacteraceae bacterium]|nr:hypothetical protein [Ktedonobacteraceae bacterium]MBO0790473.1 hypothetical protein [Ktedonobacteraceae bacterium]
MESSLQQTHVIQDETAAPLASHVEAEHEGEEPHIHLPSPSFWPLVLSVGVLIAIGALLFLPDSLWFMLVAGAFVLFGIMGWALEDPMAPSKERFITVPANGVQSRFIIGQDVVDKNGREVGVIQARFRHYVLVERGALSLKAFYVPQRLLEETDDREQVRLTVSEADLWAMEANEVPDDLYDERPDEDIPLVKGVPMFANGPLSPAETGHYHYGPNFPGMNTDASGSYSRGEVRPSPQSFVAERRKMYATSKKLPPRAVSSN